MKKSLRKLVWVLILPVCLIFLYGCSEDDEEEGIVIDSTSSASLNVVEYMVDASNKEADVWTYFSFAAGGAVTVVDPASSTDWDLAFHRLQVQTNSGTGGIGKSGAKNMGVIDFFSLGTAPTDSYVVDTELEKQGHGGTVTKYSGNSEMKDWYDMEGMPPDITSKNEVFAVKTADGQYAKMQFLDYYSKEGVSGFVTVRYVYQPDGSTNLK